MRSPHLFVSLVPLFPQIPKFDSRELLELANSIPSVRSSMPHVDRKVPWQEHNWRTIPNGISLKGRGFIYASQYIEIGSFGDMFFDFLVPRQPVRDLPIGRDTDEMCIRSYIVISSLDIALKYSSQLQQNLSLREPYKLRTTIEGVLDFLLHFQSPSSNNLLDLERLSLPCPENVIELLDEEIIPPLEIDRIQLLENRFAQNIAWAFGLGWNDTDISKWIANHY